MEQVAESLQEPPSRPELAPESASRPQTDRFLDEIRFMHRLRAELSSLSSARRAEVARRLGDGYADDWVLTARDAQLPPPDLSWCWLLLGGRGTGKTRALSGAVHVAIRAGLRRIHAISPTIADYREVMINGPSGLMATCDAGERPRWIASRRQLEWANGARVTCFSAEDPESLRGPQAELVVCDEIARMRYQQEIFDNAMFGLRLGDRPRIFLATTPRTTLFMKRLLAMKGVTITTGSTYDNAQHLPPEFLAKVRELYEGTRLGRQELQGAMLLDPANALFKDEWIVRHEVPEDLIEQVTVGVDPSGGGDEIGIIVCALLTDGRYAILADRSLRGSPGQWGDAVVRAHDEFDADDCAVEINWGGVMCAEVITAAAERMYHRGERPSSAIRISKVNAIRGKSIRAEPVSLKYEKNQVLHRRGLDLLEAEMMSFSREWDRAVDGSPNRLDAMVWGLSRLGRVLTDIPIA